MTSPPSQANRDSSIQQNIGLYVHVPFCRVKCGYCDFYSRVGGPEEFKPLVEALLVELESAVQRRDRRVETIFVGGGTPTVLPLPMLDRLLGRLGEIARRDGAVEFTVEVNPATVDHAKAQLLATHGVDRISMGAQSFDAGELATLGREHRPSDVAATLDNLRREGITRHNLDLIFGVPGQTLDSWQRSLQAAIDLQPEHLSCYGLTFEPGTPLYQRRQRGEVLPVDEDVEVQMYLATMDVLEVTGYRQYEISNYAIPGRECRHNLRYWHNRAGIGIGPAAASYFAGRRWRNVPDTNEYVRLIQRGASVEVDAEILSPLDRAGETAMLNLRLVEGIERESFRHDTGFDPFELFAEVISEHIAAGLLVVDDKYIALTKPGRLVGDAVIADFLRPRKGDT